METLMIIDGNSIVNRAYYGIHPLSTKEGIPTNGIFGFMNILLKNLDDIKPDYLCVAFDLKAPTFRHKEYEQYKAQRKGMPEDLAAQMPHLKELLSTMNITMLWAEGFEADDIIGTVSAMCENKGIECKIITGDRDDLQLVSPLTHVLLTSTKGGQTVCDEYDDVMFTEKYGVTPRQYIAVKGLMGDSSDNIPGVCGIGEKSAFSLIQKFQSIDGIYENIDSAEIKKAQRQKLIDGKDDAYLSEHLATIVRDMPLDFEIENSRIKEYDKPALRKKLEQLELKKLAERLDMSHEPQREEIALLDATKDVLEAQKNASEIYFCEENGKICFEYEKVGYVCEISDLADVAQNESIKKYVFDYKRLRHIFNEQGFDLLGEYYDFELAEYVLEPTLSSYEPKNVMERHGISPSVANLSTLYEAQTKEILHNNQEKLLYEIEFPLANVLYKMECAGFCVNKEELAEFGEKLGERLEALEGSIYFMAGKKFNINSPKQLGEVLFEDLGLPIVKKNKRGYSTDSEVLEKLSGKHEIVDLISEYRVLGKLKSTYTDGLLSVIGTDGRIHSTLNQTVTATGRISSANPNLQNIPTRTELGRELRKMFVAKEGSVLCGADYSQIELRVLAHISEDENMIQAFKSNADIHAMTAAQVFNVPDFLVTSDMRSAAKTVNFGIIYGQGEFSLAKELKISLKSAKNYIQSYFETYKGVKEYMDRTIEQAEKDGFVTTIFGRRRNVDELKAKNRNIKAFGERVAMNTPIQGSAADIIKIAMIKVDKALSEECPNSRLVMQVHDELIVEAPPSEAENVAKILRREMEGAVSLNVPLVAEVKSGKRWYDTK